MTNLTREEWARRFKTRFAEILEDSDWSKEDAEEAAEHEFEAHEVFEDLYEFYENDPEGSADESLSYWTDGEEYIS